MKVHKMIFLFLLIIVHLSFAQQSNKIFSKYKTKLDSLLLEGNLSNVTDFLKKINSSHNTNLKNYNEFKSKYLGIVKKIESTENRSNEEIKKESAHLITSHDFENSLRSKNAITAFKKFKHYYKIGKIKESAKFILITFFFKNELKLKSKNRFQELLPLFETSITNKNIENASLIEAELDTLHSFLHNSSKINEKQYALLKEKLKTLIHKKNISLENIKKSYFERNYSLNLGLYPTFISEIDANLGMTYEGTTPHKWMHYHYNAPLNISVGISLSFDYKLFGNSFIGLDANYYKYHYNKIAIFYSSPPYDKKYSASFTNLNVTMKSYHLYLQQKFLNFSVYHPFVRVGFGQLYMDKSSVVPDDDYIFNKSTDNTLYSEAIILKELTLSYGLEVLSYVPKNILITVQYSYGIRYGESNWAKTKSSKLIITLGYCWE